MQEKGADFIDYDCTSLRVSEGNQGMQGINPANQLRLVVYPIIYDGFFTSQVVGNGISEPSTVGTNEPMDLQPFPLDQGDQGVWQFRVSHF